MKPIPANATGAWCTIKYHDETDTLSPVFFSFGEYDEEKDPKYDSLGRRDDAVFFYTTPDELPLLMTEDGEDFVVLSIDEYEVRNDDEADRFVEEFYKTENREPTEDEVAKFRENAGK
jgi:hypothetical protein